MAIGILDIWETPSIDPASMVLVTDCMNGYPHDLYGLLNGMTVTLSKGSTERVVQIIRESSNECTFHYMELHPQTAKELGLSNGSRCRVSFDEEKMALKLVPVAISRYNAAVRINRQTNRPNRIVIGYSLISMLGIRKQPNAMITIKRNNASAKLQLGVPNNELDESFILPAHEAAKLGITQGGNYLLEYNHATSILRLTESASNAEPLIVDRSRAGSDQEKHDTSASARAAKSRKKGIETTTTHMRRVPAKTRRPTRKQNSPLLHPSVSPIKRTLSAARHP